MASISCSAPATRTISSDMRVYALITDLAPSEAVELFMNEEDALRAAREAIADVPAWADVLHVAPIDLVDPTPNPN
jgi:hypothetical protein